jgi:hypothetical protein
VASSKNTKSQSEKNTGLSSDCENDPAYLDLKKKRDDLAKEVRNYTRTLRAYRKKHSPKPKNSLPPEKSEALCASKELVFSTPLMDSLAEAKKMKVEREEEFQKQSGLHSSWDHPKRFDLQVRVTEIQYAVETVTDFATGKSVRASMAEEGPAHFNLTWRSISNLVKMHVGFAIPINRISMMLGHTAFSSGKICRILEFTAVLGLPVYLILPEQLSDAGILSGDDTKTRVLKLRDSQNEEKQRLHQIIDDNLGWQSPRKDGKGGKTQLNVSLITGKTEDDRRSMICFFRTHLGSVGNLLGKILEWRNPKKGKVAYQGDLSTTNLPSEELQKKFQLELAGCGSHARRPFWRFKEDDPAFCYFMLRGFLMLSGLEKRIDREGRTFETTEKLRGRYGKMIWQALKNRCKAVVAGVAPTLSNGRLKFSVFPWPPKSHLNTAAQYVIRNYDELTRYLDNPRLEYTNNGRERGLRAEKTMLDGSKFRNSRNGRAVIDVLRTLNATCTTAEIEFATYLKHLYLNQEEVLEQPEKFTPFAVAKKLAEMTKDESPKTQK